jgi:hypothetical protein
VVETVGRDISDQIFERLAPHRSIRLPTGLVWPIGGSESTRLPGASGCARVHAGMTASR